MAWQFDRPEAGEGLVQVFRRPNSFYESARLKLFGLDAEANYLATNLETGTQEHHRGRDLLESGLPVAIPGKPDAAVLVYRRQP
jgi:alpha-galactosidase